MSEVVDTESGPKVEIKVEETAIPVMPTPGPKGDVDVKHEIMTKG